MPDLMTRRCSQRGAITAETAIALPFLLTFVLAGSWCVGLVTAHLQCVDASRDIARALARGDSPDDLRALITRTTPPNGAVTFHTTPAIEVTVTVAPRTLFPFLPAPTQSATATLQVEPTAGAAHDEATPS
ncbi:TadE family type IV pilus minor pilin [Kribbella sp. NPDC051587]|uniref:TadE family type IV pilus minor pilin n=1 Tax=Kribbella sp. NPDC051587 TaxID=3364119 RepID=UPI0037B40F07